MVFALPLSLPSCCMMFLCIAALCIYYLYLVFDFSVVVWSMLYVLMSSSYTVYFAAKGKFQLHLFVLTDNRVLLLLILLLNEAMTNLSLVNEIQNFYVNIHRTLVIAFLKMEVVIVLS